jgi:hypothetical protein
MWRPQKTDLFLFRARNAPMRHCSLRIQTMVSNRTLTLSPAANPKCGNRSLIPSRNREFSRQWQQGAYTGLAVPAPAVRRAPCPVVRPGALVRRAHAPAAAPRGGDYPADSPAAARSVGLASQEEFRAGRLVRSALQRHLAVVTDIGSCAGRRGCRHLHIADNSARRIPELGIVRRDFQHANIRVFR